MSLAKSKMGRKIMHAETISNYVPVRELRRQSGKSLKDVSEKAGMSINDWGKIERGYYGSTLHTLSRVAKAFGCDVEIKLIPIENTNDDT
jgi:transcriptional regulator with XRE-family HTH domain